MKLSQLRFIVETANTGSITKAAQNLYMGQPNLSKAIKDIEAELGFLIFKRNAKGVAVTPRGAELIARAKEILDKADKLEEDYFGGSVKREKLSVAVCGAEWCVSALLNCASQMESTEDFSFECFRCGREHAFELLENGEISFGVIRSYCGEDSELSEGRLKGRSIGLFKRQIVIRESIDIAHKNVIGEGDIEGLTEVSVLGAPLSGRKKSAVVGDCESAFELLNGFKAAFMFISEKEAGIVPSGFVVRDFSPSGDYEDFVVFAEAGRLSDFQRNAAAFLG